MMAHVNRRRGRKYIAVIELDDSGWVASVPDPPGRFSDDPSIKEAEARIREAISLLVETAVAKGWPVPPPRAQAFRIEV